MRKLCPNFDRDDALDTILEVPIPEEMLVDIDPDCSDGGSICRPGSNVTSWIKAQAFSKTTPDGGQPSDGGLNPEMQFVVNMVGAPLTPCPVPLDQAFNRSVRDSSFQASTAKYIIQQYIAATGGQAALTSVNSIYALGKVRMTPPSGFQIGEQGSAKADRGEIGGFVLWQKSPEVWYFELIMGGSKMSAGCDGDVTWRQSMSAEHSVASKGLPRPLRRIIQGLDPRSTANLFSDAVCIGEKIMNDEECFILKLEALPAVLKGRSAANFDLIHHKIWGYFSQRTGLLVQVEDTHLLRMKDSRSGEDDIFWEKTMVSSVEDYRYINGVNVAHVGRTTLTLFRYGDGATSHRRKMEETWSIEEVDFNLSGLSMDCFLPPADLTREDDDTQGAGW